MHGCRKVSHRLSGDYDLSFPGNFYSMPRPANKSLHALNQGRSHVSSAASSLLRPSVIYFSQSSDSGMLETALLVMKCRESLIDASLLFLVPIKSTVGHAKMCS